MNIFPVMILVGLCALITFGAIFSAAMFQSISVEGNTYNNSTAAANTTREQSTIQSHSITSAWIYIIAVLLIIAVIIMAFKLYF